MPDDKDETLNQTTAGNGLATVSGPDMPIHLAIDARLSRIDAIKEADTSTGHSPTCPAPDGKDTIAIYASEGRMTAKSRAECLHASALTRLGPGTKRLRGGARRPT